ncbi:excalibur calcium-binding domain-containing protein [Paenibacillus sp. NPDC055715]
MKETISVIVGLISIFLFWYGIYLFITNSKDRRYYGLAYVLISVFAIYILTSIDKREGNDEGSTYYNNCTEARLAGVTPIYRGESGYRSSLDRDDDGIACE